MPTLVEQLKKAEENEKKKMNLETPSFNLSNNQTYMTYSKKRPQKELIPQSTMATLI